MTRIELANKYREIFVNKVSDSIVTVDLWLDKTRDCYQHINILFANNKLLYTGARTYVFGQNIHDIFTFFNVDKNDFYYWKEKCEAASEPIIITEVNEVKASRITDIKTSGKDFATYIECDISNTGKSVRKNVTLPEWLCRRAEKASVNFSQVLQESLIEKLGISAIATN